MLHRNNGTSRPPIVLLGSELISEGIPAAPAKSETLSQWNHSFAAAAAEAFLTSG
jgi:hypothetical protein